MAGINYRFRLTAAKEVKAMAKYLQKEFLNVLHNNVDAVVEDIGEDIKADLDGLTSTWNHVVDFSVDKAFLSINSVTVTITTDDPAFNYLDQGTEKRFAVMSTPFVAKTTPNSLVSGRGVGGKVALTKHQLPGILARNFYKTLADEHWDNYRESMKAAYIAALDQIKLR